jgi:hypothetical protein
MLVPGGQRLLLVAGDHCVSLLAAIHAPTAAAPLLWLGLQKIAHTPTPRLAVGYRLEPRCPPWSAPCCCLSVEELAARAAAGDLDRPQAPLPVARPLGANLLLDRLLAGGTVGEALPLANRRLECERRMAGLLLDVQA